MDDVDEEEDEDNGIVAFALFDDNQANNNFSPCFNIDFLFQMGKEQVPRSTGSEKPSLR